MITWQTIDDLGTILSIWAHPDDETYLAGAVMAAASDRGQRVVCATATAGERGTDDAHAWPPARLAAVRGWEATAAMAVLGVREHVVLGLPDGGLAAHHREGLRRVGDLIEEVRPDTILTFGPDGQTFHPDHIAVHRWVTEAWQRLGCQERLLHTALTTDHVEGFGHLSDRIGVYMTDARPVGVPASDLALHLRAAGPLLDRKLTALRALATQTRAPMATVPPATFAAWVAEEAFVDAPRVAGLVRMETLSTSMSGAR